MSQGLKISGKRVILPEETQEGQAWSIESRPGGRLVAIQGNRRRRVAFLKKGSQIFFHLGQRCGVAEVARGSADTGDDSGADDSDLTAQFPGKVRKLLCKVGDEVQAGVDLVQVEAMKMEFTIKAPFAGKVSEILVEEGQQLQPGDRFLEIEKGSSK